MSRLEPDEATFAIEQCWKDLDTDVELVELRYVWTLPDELPDWSAEHSRVMVPIGEQDGLMTRRCEVDLPCGAQGSSQFLWHYYFLVIERGRQGTTAPISEPIVSREIVYPDDRCRYQSMAVQWGAEDRMLLNYTELIAGEVARAQASVAAAFPPGGPTQAVGRSRLLRAFRGRIWGQPGSAVRCVFLSVSSNDETGAQETGHDAIWVELL